jgi:hypothetical protein
LVCLRSPTTFVRSFKAWHVWRVWRGWHVWASGWTPGRAWTSYAHDTGTLGVWQRLAASGRLGVWHVWSTSGQRLADVWITSGRGSSGDLKVSMSISQQGGFAGDTITLSISSLGALCVKNSVFLALPASYTITRVFFRVGLGVSHFEPGPRSSLTLKNNQS